MINPFSGDGGIRTPEPSFPDCQFSKLVVSATHPHLQIFPIPFGTDGKDK